jgi:hypothetical protein
MVSAVVASIRRSLKQIAGSTGRIVPETFDLVHAFMQDRHDPDGAVRQYAPINVVVFAADVEALDAELGGDRTPCDPAGRNVLETRKQTTDIGLPLRLTPGLAAVVVDVVEPTTGCFLYTKVGYVAQRRGVRAKTASALRAV